MTKNTTKPTTKPTTKRTTKSTGKRTTKPASQKAGNVTVTVSKAQAAALAAAKAARKAAADKAAAELRVVAVGKRVQANDRKDMDNMSAAIVASESATAGFVKLAERIAKRRTWEVLITGTPNPNVLVIDPATGKKFTPAEREALKDAQANPYQRYLWFKAQADGLSRKTASNIITRIRNLAKANGVTPKVNKADKGDSTIRVIKVLKPDELSAGMGLESWVLNQQEEYPALAAYLLPALASYLGESSKQGTEE